MTSDKLHLPGEEPSLSRLLGCTDAVISSNCVIYSEPEEGAPAAVLALFRQDETTLTIDLICSKSATGVELSDFVVTGPATKSSLSGESRYFRLQLAKTGFGLVSISLPLGFAQDNSATNFPAVGPLEILLSERPVPTLTGPATITYGTSEVTVAFNEDVVGLTLADFVVQDGALSNLSGSGDSYTLDLTTADPDSQPVVILPANRCQSIGGSENVDSNAYRPTLAVQAPVPTVTPRKLVFPTIDVVFDITWTHPVSPLFLVGAIQVTNGTLTSLQEVGPQSYVARVEASGDVTVTLAVVEDSFTPPGLLHNAAGEGSCDVLTTDLIFTLTSDAPIYNDEFLVSVAGNQANTGLTRESFIVENGAVAEFTPVGNGGTAKVVSTRIGIEHTITIRLPGDAARSSSGRPSEPSDRLLIRYDDLGPRVEFSEIEQVAGVVVFNFSTHELATLVGSYSYPGAADTSIVGEGYNWTLSITPVTRTGTLAPQFPAGLFADLLGNLSPAVAGPSYEYDLDGPVATIALIPDGHENQTVTNKVRRTVQVYFDRLITEPLDENLLVFSDGLVSIGSEEVTPGRVFQVVTEATVPFAALSVTLPAHRVTDLQGRSNEFPASLGWSYDGVPPRVVEHSSEPVGKNFRWTLTFSEQVFSQLPGLLSLEGLSLVSVDYSVRTVTVVATPTRSGSVGIRLESGFVRDAAGNVNDQTPYYYVIADLVGPIPTITSTASPSTNQELIPFVISFNEPLAADLTRSDLVLENCHLNPVDYPQTFFSKRDSNRIYDLQVRAITEGTVVVSVPEARVTDDVGNPNSAGSLGVIYSPSFTLQLNVSAGDQLDQRLVRVTSESLIDLTTLTPEDFSLSLGAVEILATAQPDVFLLQLDPEAQSARVRIEAGKVLDTLGRTNLSTSVMISYSPIQVVPTLSTIASGVVLDGLIEVAVVWPAKVLSFVTDQMQGAVRSDEGNIIPSSGMVGAFVGFEVVEPGYSFLLTYQVTVLPSDLANDLHIFHQRTNDGTTDILARPVTANTFLAIPFSGPFGPDFDSESFPETSNAIIRITVTFPNLLETTLQSTDFTYENCGLGAGFAGTSFTPGATNDTYELVVRAITMGDVVVTLPAGSATSVDGVSSSEGSITVRWVGNSRFALSHTLLPGAHPDQRVLRITSSTPMDYSQVNLASLQFNNQRMLIEQLGDAHFLIQLRPISALSSVVIPEGAYTNNLGQSNLSYAVDISWSIQPPRPAVTITDEVLAWPDPLRFSVQWPAKVTGFTASDLVAALRDSNQNIISGFQSSGTIAALTVLEEGYRYSGVFTLDAQPLTDQYDFFIHHEPPTGAEDLFGEPADRVGFDSVPVNPPLQLVITSAQAPDTELSPVTFTIVSNRALVTDLQSSDLVITNASIDPAVPGTLFQVVTPGLEYTARVVPDDHGVVTLAIPADVVNDENLCNNIASDSLSVNYQERFDVTSQVLPTQYADIYKWVLNLPADVQGSQLTSGMVETGCRGKQVFKVAGEDAFLVHFHTETGQSGPCPGVPVTEQTSLLIPAGSLVSDTGARNRPVTAVAPEIPSELDLTITLTPQPVTSGAEFTIRSVSNTYCEISNSAADPGFVFRLRHELSNGLPISDGYILLSATLRDLDATSVEQGYVYEWDAEFAALIPPNPPQDDSLYLTLVDTSGDGVGDQARWGDNSWNRPRFASYRDKIDTTQTPSQYEVEWTGKVGAELRRDLIVELYGVSSGITELLDIDWGDGATETLEISDAFSVDPNGYIVFHLSHEYVDQLTKTVTMESLSTRMNIAGLKAAKIVDGLMVPVDILDEEENTLHKITGANASGLWNVVAGNNTLGISHLLSDTPVSRSIQTYVGHLVAVDKDYVVWGRGGLTPLYPIELRVKTDQSFSSFFDGPPSTAGDYSFSQTDPFGVSPTMFARMERFELVFTGTEGTPFSPAFDRNWEEFIVRGPMAVQLRRYGSRSLYDTYPDNVIFSDLSSTLVRVDRYSTLRPDAVLEGFVTFQDLRSETTEVQFDWALDNLLEQYLRVELLDHNMTLQAEGLFYSGLRAGILATDPALLGTGHLVHTRRDPALGISPASTTEAIVQQIRNHLISIGRSDAFTIILE